MNRRHFLWGIAALAAAGYIGLITPTRVNQDEISRILGPEKMKKVGAIEAACNQIEGFTAAQTSIIDEAYKNQVGEAVHLFYAPHADWIHFNRTETDQNREWFELKEYMEAGNATHRENFLVNLPDEERRVYFDTLNIMLQYTNSIAYCCCLSIADERNPDITSKFVWENNPSGNHFKLQKLRVKARNWMSDEEISAEERRIVTLADLIGRSEFKGSIAVVKHFPGSPIEGELSEFGSYSMDLSLEELLDTYLLPFTDVINAGAQAVMVNKISYPKVEEELATRFNFPEVFHDVNKPACFSPLIVRGLLRTDMGFKGLVVGDPGLYDKTQSMIWVELDNINKLIREGKMPEAYWHLTEESWKFIGYMYAGVDFVDGEKTTVNYQGLRDNAAFLEVYNYDPILRRYIDESFLRLSKFILKEFPGRLSIRIEDAPNVNLFDKIAVILNHDCTIFHRLNACDPWDRGAALHERFKRAYLTAMTGTDFVSFPREQKNPEYFRLRDQTDWKALDPLYRHVIETRYLKR